MSSYVNMTGLTAVARTAAKYCLFVSFSFDLICSCWSTFVKDNFKQILVVFVQGFKDLSVQ